MFSVISKLLLKKKKLF